MSPKNESSGSRNCWYWPLYPFTKICIAFTAAVLVAANYPAFEVPCAGMQDGKYGPHFETEWRYEHGWPLRYCRRESWREVATPLPTTELTSPWTPWLDAEDVHWLALVLDSVLAILSCFAAGAIAQRWRSKRKAIWQFTIADFLWLLAISGAILAWLGNIRSQQAKELRILTTQAQQLNTQAQQVNFGFVARGTSVPVYLPKSMKELYHRQFDRVLEFDADDGDARLATDLRRLLVLTRPEANANLGAYLQRLQQLEAIDFFMCGLHGEDPMSPVLRSLSPMPHLRGINLYDTDANDDDMLWLAKCPRLERICLIDTEITDVGLKRLCHLPNLRFLDVSSERLTNDGCRWIAEMSNLEELYVGSDRISDEGIEHLARLKKLKTLDLSTAASNGAIQSLRQSLPRCEVYNR